MKVICIVYIYMRVRYSLLYVFLSKPSSEWLLTVVIWMKLFCNCAGVLKTTWFHHFQQASSGTLHVLIPCEFCPLNECISYLCECRCVYAIRLTGIPGIFWLCRVLSQNPISSFPDRVFSNLINLRELWVHPKYSTISIFLVLSCWKLLTSFILDVPKFKCVCRLETGIL